MSILLSGQDYATDGAGGVVSVSDGSAVLNDVLFRLTARRGSFPLLPNVGSRLHLLRRAKPSQWAILARQYAAEALEEMEDVAVTDAAVWAEDDRLSIRVELTWQGQRLSVELEG